LVDLPLEIIAPNAEILGAYAVATSFHSQFNANSLVQAPTDHQIDRA